MTGTFSFVSVAMGITYYYRQYGTYFQIAGTMGLETEPAKPEPQMGSLYSLEKNRTLRKHLEKIDISNGLAWSLDNKTMYYIDSLPRKVYAFDFDLEAGTICKSTFLYVPDSSNFM